MFFASDASGFPGNFADQLSGDGTIEKANVDRALRASAESGVRFDRVLTKLGLLSEDELAAKLAEFLGIQSIGPEALPSPPPDVDGLSVEFLKRRGIVPVSIQSGFLELAVVDPFDSDSIGAVEYLTGLECRLRLMSPATSEVATERLSDGGVDNTTRETPDARFASADGDLRRLEEMANEAPIIKLVNQILAKAVESGASDVHLEPEPAGLVVRMRHDGALATYQVLPPGVRAAVASRVKIMSRLDIAERRLPQDGRMKMPVRGIDVDFRVATLPTMHGEAVVIRVLDGRNVRLGFDALGFDDDATVRIRSAISNPNGLVFVTGPTGSGKTTTLYAALAELNRPDAKLFSVEDPVEYQLRGVNQVQVEPAIGLDFPTALKAILRQDPDVVMIGEVRDAQTARIAVQASLTGHLVLSTLHTNGAAAAVVRLADMGVERFLIASTLRAVVAQRLVRKLCTRCARAADPAAVAATFSAMGAEPNGAGSYLEPAGCSTCRGTGYVGRTTIHEFIEVGAAMREAILRGGADREIGRAAIASGMKRMIDRGLEKAALGETSLQEVFRAVGSD